MTVRKLNPKRQAFVNEYLQCWNATEAAKRAGYSAKTAYSVGYELLRIAEIAEAIDERIKANTMSADEVLWRLAEIARTNIYDFVTENGVRWDNIKKRGHLIKSITPTKDGTKLEVHDQVQALLSIGKHLRLFSDVLMKVDVSTLSDEQIERILKGEDPLAVIFSDKSQRGAGTPTPPTDPEPGAEPV
jgi:hypothetical protein